MTCEETYYRRAYTMFNELEKACINGFDLNQIGLMWLDSEKDKQRNSALVYQKTAALKLTILIALMGLNKETIDKANVFATYDDTLLNKSSIINPKYQIILDSVLKDNRKYKTDFDKWLAISKMPQDDDNNTIIKRLRNGFLHSNFIFSTSDELSFTKINTKSFYESYINNELFAEFALSYFANTDTMGVNDKCQFPVSTVNIKITDEKALKKFIDNNYLISFTYNIKNFNGENAINQIIQKYLANHNNKMEFTKLAKIFDNNNNLTNMQFSEFSSEAKEIIFNTIMTKYGKDFFKLSEEEKNKIISLTFDHYINPKKSINNYLTSLFQVLNIAADPENNHDLNYFNDDDKCYGLEETFVILKSYLMLYRLQNRTFEEIDYSLIDSNFIVDTKLFCENNGILTSINYYSDTYNKYRNQEQNANLANEELTYKIIIGTIRDALAHGNIELVYDKDNNPIFIFRDVNEKKGTTKGIRISVSGLRKLLNSEAFLPKYCKIINNKIISNFYRI